MRYAPRLLASLTGAKPRSRKQALAEHAVQTPSRGQGFCCGSGSPDCSAVGKAVAGTAAGLQEPFLHGAPRRDRHHRWAGTVSKQNGIHLRILECVVYFLFPS